MRESQATTRDPCAGERRTAISPHHVRACGHAHAVDRGAARAEALKLELSFSEQVSLTKRQTINAAAYDLYLRAQDYLNRMTNRSVEYSIRLFEKALELSRDDPLIL